MRAVREKLTTTSRTGKSVYICRGHGFRPAETQTDSNELNDTGFEPWCLPPRRVEGHNVLQHLAWATRGKLISTNRTGKNVYVCQSQGVRCECLRAFPGRVCPAVLQHHQIRVTAPHSTCLGLACQLTFIVFVSCALTPADNLRCNCRGDWKQQRQPQGNRVRVSRPTTGPHTRGSGEG